MAVASVAALATSYSQPSLSSTSGQDTISFDATHRIETRKLVVTVDPQGLPAAATVDLQIPGGVEGGKPELDVSVVNDGSGIRETWEPENTTIEVCDPCGKGTTVVTYTITIERLDVSGASYNFNLIADPTAIFIGDPSKLSNVPRGASIEASITTP